MVSPGAPPRPVVLCILWNGHRCIAWGRYLREPDVHDVSLGIVSADRKAAQRPRDARP